MAAHVTASSVNSIPFYEADDSARQWLTRLERASRMYGWTDEQTLDVAVCRLGDTAAKWYSGVETTINTWDLFKETFLERFDVDKEELYNLLSSCCQERWESVREYADRFRDLASQLSINLNQDPTYTYNFLHGLLPAVYDMVYLMKPRTLDAAIRDAIYIDEGRHRRGTFPVNGNSYPDPRDRLFHRRPDRHDRRGGWGGYRREDAEEGFRPALAPRFQDRRDAGRPLNVPPPPPDRRGPPHPVPRPQAQGGDGRRDQGRGGSGDRRDVNPARPAQPGTGGGNSNVMDELARQMGRLSLLLEANMGGGAAHLTDMCGEAAGAIDGYDYEAYHKRVSDFDYIPPPRKRVPAAPDQDSPRGPNVRPGMQPTHVDSPFPQPPARPPRQAAAAATGAAVYRPRRTPGEPSGRTDPVPPADPAMLDQQITNDVIQRVGKYPVPLRVAVDCNPAQIHAKVGSQLLQIARQKQGGVSAAASPPAFPAAAAARAPAFGPLPPPGFHRAPPAAAREGPTPMETHHVAAHTSVPLRVQQPSHCWQVCKTEILLANGQGEWSPVTAIVDSGASHSVITRNTLRQLDLLESLQESSATFLNACGRRGKVAGKVQGLQVSTGDMCMRLNPFVSQALNYEMLLGTDFLYPARANISYETRRLEYINDSDTRGSIPIQFLRMQQPVAMEAELEDDLEHTVYLMDGSEGERLPQRGGCFTGAPCSVASLATESSGSFGTGPLETIREEDNEEGASVGSASETYGGSSVPPFSDVGEEDGDKETSSAASEDTLTELPPASSLRQPAATPAVESEPMILYHPHLVQKALGSPPAPSGADHDGHLEAARQYGIHARALLRGIEPRPELRDAILATIDPELPAEHLNQLAECLLRNYDVFALTTRELGCTSWVDFKIDTGDHPPIAQQPYRMSRVEKEAVDNAISEMKADGVVEDSTSPWVSPIVVVAKKNGKMRPCVDLRKVNAVTRDVRYPLGHIQDILDSVAPPAGEQRWHASIDMLSGYWQVPIVDPASRLRTGFASPSGQYQYCRMPMGAKGAAAVFSHLANKMLGPLLQAPPLGSPPDSPPADDEGSGGQGSPYRREHCVAVYLDDILISSQSFTAHLWHVCMVLDLIRYASLKASVTKCEFGKRKVVFLGHLLDGLRGVVAPSPRNVANIAALPAPRCVRELRAFLGTVGYYRTMIANFASIAQPLHALLTKDAPWVWTAEQQQAYETLKMTLLTEPVLRAPDFSRPFIIQVDWCRTAVAACLAQMDDTGQEYAVQFASKAMTGSQLNYCSADGEAFAAVWAIKKFHPYIYGTRTVLITDSMAVRYLQSASASDLHGKLGRYALILQAYDLDIQHKAGKKNSNVDGLSRLGHLLDPGSSPTAEEDYEAETYIQGEGWPVLLSDGMREAAAPTYFTPDPRRGSQGSASSHTSPGSAPRPEGSSILRHITNCTSQPRTHDLPFPQPGLQAAGVENAAGGPPSSQRQAQRRPSQAAATGLAAAATVAAASCGAHSDGEGPEEQEEQDQQEELAEPSCVVCRQLHPRANLIFCDAPGCGLPWHFHCLDPPLPGIPKRWYCPLHLTQPYDDDWHPPAPRNSSSTSLTSSTATTGAGEDAGFVPEGDGKGAPAEDTEEEVEIESEEGVPVLGGPSPPKPRRGGRRAGTGEVWTDLPFINFMKTGEMPMDPEKTGKENFTEMQRLHNKAKGFVWTEGRLYKLLKGQRYWFPPPDQRVGLITEAHGMAHQGVDKVLSILNSTCFWPNMRGTIKLFTDKCEGCKPGRHKLVRGAPLRPLHVVPMWSVVHVDLAGPLPATPRGNRYIALCVDGWSKWPEVGALPNKEAATCSRWFWQNWITRYGTPHTVVTDRGREWEGDFHALLTCNRIIHRHTAPNNPQANGQCERLVGVVMEALRKMVNEEQDDWDEKIFEVAYAYRASRQASTRVSPALCVFGRELTTAAARPEPPPDPPAWGEEEEEAQGLQPEDYEMLEERRQALEQLAGQVDDNLVKAKARNEKDYRKRRAPSRPRDLPAKRRKPNPPAPPAAERTAATTTPHQDAAGTVHCAGSPPPKRQKTSKTSVVSNRPQGADDTVTTPPQAGTAGDSTLPTLDKPAESQKPDDTPAGDALSHLPDLPLNAKVYQLERRKKKLGPDRSGPYFFQSYNPQGTLVLVKDQEGTAFTFSTTQLLVAQAQPRKVAQ